MSNATNPSIPAVHTISEANLAAPATHAAFLAGFEGARAGKRAVAPRSYSSAERTAYKSGHAYARSLRSKTAEQALSAFLSVEGYWANSAVGSVERDYEDGAYYVVSA